MPARRSPARAGVTAAARAVQTPRRSELEQALAFRLGLAGIPFVEQYRAIPTRRWRWDFALVEHRLLIECQGGVWTQGRHVRPQGYRNDLEKANAATAAGFRTLAFTREQIETGEAMRTIQSALAADRAAGARS